MSIRSGDIRDQNEVESCPKFGRFLALPNFRGRAFQKLYPHYHPSLAALGLEKFREAAILENSNGDISATDRPIHSVFGSFKMPAYGPGFPFYPIPSVPFPSP